MAAPIDGQTCHPIIPLVKPCSSTAHRSYPSAYSSRLGSVIDNHFNCGGMIFSLVSRLSRRFIFPAKSLVPTGTAFTACPAYRFPVIPGRLNFLRWRHHTSSRCAARTCRLPGFYFWFYSGGIYLVIYKTGNSIFLWWIYSRMKELLSSPLCRDIPESEQVDCLFCLERYDCANSIPPEFFQLNDEFQRRRYINRRRTAKWNPVPLLPTFIPLAASALSIG